MSSPTLETTSYRIQKNSISKMKQNRLEINGPPLSEKTISHSSHVFSQMKRPSIVGPRDSFLSGRRTDPVRRRGGPVPGYVFQGKGERVDGMNGCRIFRKGRPGETMPVIT